MYVNLANFRVLIFYGASSREVYCDTSPHQSVKLLAPSFDSNLMPNVQGGNGDFLKVNVNLYTTNLVNFSELQKFMKGQGILLLGSPSGLPLSFELAGGGVWLFLSYICFILFLLCYSLESVSTNVQFRLFSSLNNCSPLVT